MRSGGNEEGLTWGRLQKKGATGRVSALDVCWEDTGVDLKRRVIQKIGLKNDVDRLRLIFAGKQLEDARSLRHQGLTNHCIVHVVLKCKCRVTMGGSAGRGVQEKGLDGVARRVSDRGEEREAGRCCPYEGLVTAFTKGTDQLN
uniref:Ubiquitin-like domain-containing protein n=1 Tax=Terrapene triunguis TaxID=2587831 RepID=A0A674JGR6_9SAUR